MISVENLAAIIADAFGPLFASAASAPGKPFRRPVPYSEMPEVTKKIFRGIAEQVIAQRGKWDSIV